MRKILSLLLCLPLALLCAPALAQDLEDLGAMDTATGAVEAARTVDVTAPFSGVLLPFDVEAGDRVEAGEALLCMDTTKVYAPFDGTLSAVFAGEGDDADAFTARYGGLASLEPAERLTLDCTAYGAYDDAEHKIVHVGETLYYKNATGDKVTGTGRVVAVTAEGFQVEVLTGEPEVGQRVECLHKRNEVLGGISGKRYIQKRSETTPTKPLQLLKRLLHSWIPQANGVAEIARCWGADNRLPISRCGNNLERFCRYDINRGDMLVKEPNHLLLCRKDT